MIRLLVLILFWSLSVFAAAPAPKFQPYRPPFYTMTFEEIQNLEQPLYDGAVNQKEQYLKDLAQLLPLFSPAEIDHAWRNSNINSLRATSHDKTAWNKLRQDIFKACSTYADNGVVCGKLIRARTFALTMYSGSHNASGSPEQR